MSTGSDSSVIRKKALSGREDFDVRAMSWSKAVRLSLERVSDRLFDLQLAVRTVEQVSCTLADLKSVASGDRLVMLLDAYGGMVSDAAHHGMAGRGAAVLDRGLIQTLVEVQTRGRITQAELEERPFTYTDAAVTAQLIDPVLSSVDDMMSDTPQSPEPLRLRYGDKVEDARALLLALEAPDYILFRISLDIEEGVRSADLVLAIPEDMLRPPPPAPDPEEAETGGFDLSGMALSAPIPLNAVVARINMPLSRVCALKPGDTLPVERNVLSRTELVGSKGFVLGKVTLGQLNGFRAVRLGPDEPDATAAQAGQAASGLPTSAPGVAAALANTGALDTGALNTGALDTGLPDPMALAPLAVDELPDLGDVAGPGDLALPDLPGGGLDLEGPSDLPLDLPDLATDGLELGDLADLSGLDDATLEPSEGGLPDLPDLPSL